MDQAQLKKTMEVVKRYIDHEVAKKADSNHGTHLTLGTGSGNAYYGDKGSAAYKHSQEVHAPSNAQKNSDITKAEIEAKLTGGITTHTHSYLPLGGGTLSGNITFKDVTSTTYPAKSSTITWSGSTDAAEIYYQVLASDKGQLVFNLKDDANATLGIAFNGEVKATFDTSGNYSGNAASATKATKDSANQQITTTYIKGLSVSGQTITYTRGDGTTGTITTQDTNTTYSTASQSANGLMSSSDKTKLDGISNGANKYTHPSHTAKSSGFYKVTVDASGHVSAATAVTKADITGLGIPGSDTVYTHPTSAGNKHIPGGGSSGQILVYSSAGTAAWGAVSIPTSEPSSKSDGMIWIE